MDAVEDRAGGNHKVLAKKIASSPLGDYTCTILSCMFPLMFLENGVDNLC